MGRCPFRDTESRYRRRSAGQRNPSLVGVWVNRVVVMGGSHGGWLEAYPGNEAVPSRLCNRNPFRLAAERVIASPRGCAAGATPGFGCNRAAVGWFARAGGAVGILAEAES